MRKCLNENDDNEILYTFYNLQYFYKCVEMPLNKYVWFVA